MLAIWPKQYLQDLESGKTPTWHPIPAFTTMEELYAQLDRGKYVAVIIAGQHFLTGKVWWFIGIIATAEVKGGAVKLRDKDRMVPAFLAWNPTLDQVRLLGRADNLDQARVLKTTFFEKLKAGCRCGQGLEGAVRP
jgi:cell division FtsZ-interacting protein ZapD